MDVLYVNDTEVWIHAHNELAFLVLVVCKLILFSSALHCCDVLILELQELVLVDSR